MTSLSRRRFMGLLAVTSSLHVCGFPSRGSPGVSMKTVSTVQPEKWHPPTGENPGCPKGDLGHRFNACLDDLYAPDEG